jgi:hypothetical protein
MADKNVPKKKFNDYRTPQEVGANSFTSTLGVLCEKNNMFGLYVKESYSDDPSYDEMYFICGLDEETVRKAYKNTVAEFKDQQSKPDKFKLLHVTKLTDQSPFAVYMDVASFCMHASTLRGICNKYGFNKKFDEVSSSFVTMLETAYLDTLKPGISTFERRKRTGILKEFLETQGEKEFKKEKSKAPKMDSAPLKSDISNMLPFNELIYRHGELSRSATGSQAETDKLLNFFKSNPQIPFYQTKPLVSKLAVADDRMFGSKEDNTFYSCFFMYPSIYTKIVDSVQLKMIADPSVKFSPPINFTGEVCSFGVSIYDINGIFKLAKEKNIPLWINLEQLYYSCDPNENPETIKAGYKIFGPLAMQKQIGLLLNEYAVSFATDRILSYDDKNNYNKNNPNAISYEELKRKTQGLNR